jgi:3-hydroxy-9,10-secoandrosta-1,3,5(10)-triene-9,17-dione monooxygenase
VPTVSNAVSALQAVPIAPPEPGLTPAEMIRRAVAFRPRLREMQEECEKQGRLPEEMCKELDAAGFFRIVQPRRFGGYEFDIPTFYRVMIEIARGCTETGWVMSLVGGHSMMVAKLPEQAQVEAYGETGEMRCPGSFAPPGTAERVDGGYIVNGAWRNGSGCDISTHFMPLVMLGEGGQQTPLQVLLDRSQYEIFDDWNVMGMRGTGSKQVIAKDILIPEYRAIAVAGMNRGAEPLVADQGISDNPMYRTLVGPFLVGELAAVAVGSAWAALDHYEHLFRTKKSPYPPYQEKYRDPQALCQFGTALRLITMAQSALLQSGEDYVRYAKEQAGQGPEFDEHKELGLRLVAIQCVQTAWEAFDLIFQTSGTSSSARVDHPLSRLLRNFAVLRTHAVLQLDSSAVAAARIHFGLER